MLDRIKKKTYIYKDFLLSLFSSAISTFISQIIVYPILAQKLSNDEYGVILTTVAVANTLISALGNSLNNTRLIVQAEYENEKVEGDFMPLCLILSIIASTIYFVYLTWLNRYTLSTVVLMVLFVLLGVLRTYGAVSFRLTINYLANLWLSICVALGNAIGVAALVVSNSKNAWVLVFLFGEIIGVIYLLSTPIYKEKKKFTKLFRRTLGKEAILLITTLSANLLVYLDRLLLYPILGSEAVAVYAVASFFGKSLGIVVTPLSGVLLSYYSKRQYTMTLSKYRLTSGATFSLSILFIGVCRLISRPITGVFYPTLIDEAEPILNLANIASVIAVAVNLISPAVLRYAKTYWQIIIQVLYFAIYFGLGVWASREYGLVGFAYASIVAVLIKFFVLYFVGEFSIRKYQKETM